MKKTLQKVLIGLMIVLAVGLGAFLIYVSDYYRADAAALAVLDLPSVRMEEDHVILQPASPGQTGLIFYPGGKVEHLAYLPLLERITQTSGITSVIAKMPFRLAVFDVNAADRIMAQYPQITRWYIAGHSLGGAMASSYASGHPDRIEGLILLGAYLYGDYPAEDSLTVYGTLNTAVADKVDYTQNVIIIEGGNHAQFGNYGRQKGDPEAVISAAEQQDQTVEAVRQFLAARSGRILHIA